MTDEQSEEAERYFADKRARENPVQKLVGWEHDCGYHTDEESLFLQHVEDCGIVNEPHEPIYRAVLKSLRPQEKGL